MAPRVKRWKAGYAGPACPKCRRTVRGTPLDRGEQTCPSCYQAYEVAWFNPLETLAELPETAGLGPEESAPCSTHERNQAVAACQRCGQFICSLCKTEADGKIWCPPCFERLSSEGALASTATRFKNYAGLATLCILAGWLLGALMITIPACSLGIYYCIRGIKDKHSRGETDGIAGLYLRIVVCLLFMAFGVFMFYAMFGGLN